MPSFRPHRPQLRLRTRPLAMALLAALLCAASVLTWTVAAAEDDPAPVHRQDRTLTGAGGIRLDTSYYLPSGRAGGAAKDRRPAVLLAHGFGGTKDSERDRAERLARAGYAVLTYSARGFGASEGRIGLNAADGEVADAVRLVDWLATRPEVALDRTGDPVIGMAGGSYGGAVSLLAAARDRRIDALVPSVTYWDLEQALFPQGVFKKLWAGVFFAQGLTDPRDPQCGRFGAEVCAAFVRAAAHGRADERTSKLLRSVSPATYGKRIRVPTLVVQGRTDSLFPLGQGDALAAAVAANGAPVAVDWIAGGHDGGDREEPRIADRTVAWFDAYLKHRPTGPGPADAKSPAAGPAFRVSRTAGAATAGPGADDEAAPQGATADRYPGLDGTARRTVPLDPAPRILINPPGGTPPTLTGGPGLGALAALSQLPAGVGGAPGADGPGVGGPAGGRPASAAPVGQHAAFDAPPLTQPLHLTGSPTLDLTVRTEREAVLFVKLYDAAPDGRQTLPQQLVTPIRALSSGTVRVTLPAVDHLFAAGHRMRLVVSSTDFGYASPAAPATHQVRAGALTVPTVAGLTAPASDATPGWVPVLPAAALVLAAVLLLPLRRGGSTPAPDPGLADVPLRIEALSKRYAGGSGDYAVRDLSLSVERGQVLGLLGPNGAGKTTTLRMLMGLVHPDDGELRIFGHPVRPGAPVLSRLGSFVEGPGFLPHLTGRQNLDLYWRATGRPTADAHVEEALAVAGLGTALDRAVRTYSQGMRQRLAIAQAMLGLPDLLVLDEPTNGLDPGQIREMRDVLTRYAATGRTVVVSSHLLAEVEQCCTHLVVMDRGRLVAAGEVGEITSDHLRLEDAFLTLTGGEQK
ncbi:alpha/beta fold hydrolase [Streptomyces sp. NPDC051561]|uniref:alpha/beta fold hydrolase n=1 Tax=Streptomyces sp. NPDC051561 TaxID=3365658 RepID=UPI0037B9B8DC